MLCTGRSIRREPKSASKTLVVDLLLPLAVSANLLVMGTKRAATEHCAVSSAWATRGAKSTARGREERRDGVREWRDHGPAVTASGTVASSESSATAYQRSDSTRRGSLDGRLRRNPRQAARP
eukprot:2559719-Prymnesium_polylepis.1